MKIKQIAVAGLLLIAMMSCSWKPTDQEIKTMEDARAAAMKAKKTDDERKTELRKLQQEIEAAKAKKAAAERENQKVKDELAKRASGN